MKTKLILQAMAILSLVTLVFISSACKEDGKDNLKAESERAEKEQQLRAEAKSAEIEREKLERRLEEVQNNILRETEKTEQASKDAAKQAENQMLRDRLAALENQLVEIQEKQVANALPVSNPESLGNNDQHSGQERHINGDESTDHQHQPERPQESGNYSSVQNSDHHLDSQPPAIANVSYFYEPLSRYGNWIHTPDYGYVWSPRNGFQNDWHPYQNGRWMQTSYGWTWISNEPHGWATCHYGRWARNSGLGWLWVPETTWAPAWVSWRVGKQFAGWAPLPPETCRTNSFGNDVERRYNIPVSTYRFVRVNDLRRPDYLSRFVANNQYYACFQSTSNVTRIDHNHGRAVHHQGLAASPGNRHGSTVPQVNLSFDDHQSGTHDHLGAVQPKGTNGKLILRVSKPQKTVQSAPQNFTRVKLNLFKTLIQRATQKQAVAQPVPAPPTQTRISHTNQHPQQGTKRSMKPAVHPATPTAVVAPEKKPTPQKPVIIAKPALPAPKKPPAKAVAPKPTSSTDTSLTLKQRMEAFRKAMQTVTPAKPAPKAVTPQPGVIPKVNQPKPQMKPTPFPAAVKPTAKTPLSVKQTPPVKIIKTTPAPPMKTSPVPVAPKPTSSTDTSLLLNQRMEAFRKATQKVTPAKPAPKAVTPQPAVIPKVNQPKPQMKPTPFPAAVKPTAKTPLPVKQTPPVKIIKKTPAPPIKTSPVPVAPKPTSSTDTSLLLKQRMEAFRKATQKVTPAKPAPKAVTPQPAVIPKKVNQPKPQMRPTPFPVAVKPTAKTPLPVKQTPPAKIIKTTPAPPMKTSPVPVVSKPKPAVIPPTPPQIKKTPPPAVAKPAPQLPPKSPAPVPKKTP